jgi:hypothetical protein
MVRRRQRAIREPTKDALSVERGADQESRPGGRQDHAVADMNIRRQR